MAPEIKILNNNHEADYNEFLHRCEDAMIYHSIPYKNFLTEFLSDDAEINYFLLYSNNDLVAALPTAIVDGPYGKILNSLPFFGSHGSIIQTGSEDEKRFLLNYFLSYCEKHKIKFSTIIDTPFTNNSSFYESFMGVDFHDYRIGQIKKLSSASNKSDCSENLFLSYHQKTRNMVRKALKSDLTYQCDTSSDAISALHKLHQSNLISIGGIPKPRRFFDAIRNNFNEGSQFRVYTAKCNDGKIVCALMLLYFKNIVEYFVPATSPEWRSTQPLSALIHISMIDAIIENGSEIWNWGGTWASQEGVHRFKLRWGSIDIPYNYYTKIFGEKESIIDLDKSILLEKYPWFYTLPFSELI
tara:strand:- start:3720 stop:4787 length:1068 start_codon:yes stop_codon:yes gene_type:complete